MATREDFDAVLKRHLPLLENDVAPEFDASMPELGLDSQATMQLLADLEESLLILFPDEELTVATFATPGALWEVVSGLLSHAAG